MYHVELASKRMTEKKTTTRRRRPARSAEYFRGVADARFVIRKVFRIVDERAKSRELDPLEHQALIQIYGARGRDLRVGDVAERLDISPAFASKLVKSLSQKGLVLSSPSLEDQRVTHLKASAKGEALLIEIDADVREHVNFFARQLTHGQKAAALSIFAFYVGTNIEIEQSGKNEG
jgi:DNA-binding MarR family transcriptional regulator